VLVPDLAPFAESAQQGLGLLFLKFGRDAEKQADELGAEYSSRLNYDASEMAEFFKTLERQDQQSGQFIPEFLSTHPNPGTDMLLLVNWQKNGKRNLNSPIPR
jgi:predicted Zn-dependent protease